MGEGWKAISLEISGDKISGAVMVIVDVLANVLQRNRTISHVCVSLCLCVCIHVCACVERDLF